VSLAAVLASRKPGAPMSRKTVSFPVCNASLMVNSVDRSRSTTLSASGITTCCMAAAAGAAFGAAVGAVLAGGA
jgi:hypothetical protein